jgi:hypothetical protein
MSPNSTKHKVDKNILISTLINKILQQRPRNEHAQGRLPLGQLGIIKSMPLEWQAAPSPWWWCLLVVCVVVDWLIACTSHVKYGTKITLR